MILNETTLFMDLTYYVSIYNRYTKHKVKRIKAYYCAKLLVLNGRQQERIERIWKL